MKITLTAEEEVMYLRELDKLQDMMPDLEIQVIAEPAAPYMDMPLHAGETMGAEFRAFLHSTQTAHQQATAANG
jgi:hypothetical protein